MRISVIGTGYLGAVHAAGMAELGFEVVGIDVDAAKVTALADGRAPFYEPELEPLLRKHVGSRLTFTTDLAAAAGSSVHFLCIGTPQRSDGPGADLTYLDAAVGSLLPHLRPGTLVVGKSTVPVGTAARIADLVEATGAELAWNPEFLREGYAVEDTLRPDRLVFGVRGGGAEVILRQVYADAIAADTPVVVTDLPTSELVKTSANAFLATKISFINAIAEICEVTGADVTTLADAIGHDARIGRKFLGAGLGFGGGCLPKDVRAFQARATELGVGDSLKFLAEVDAVNLRRRERVLALAAEALDGDVAGRRIGVLGVSFKPHSDDVRDSPALDVSRRLVELGAEVRVYDPVATESARRVAPHLEYADTLGEAVHEAEVVLHLTEWPEFRAADPAALGTQVARRQVIDGRNCLDRERWRAAGWSYVGLGVA
ncbi:UDP-glucose dehydrogenase family protein [Nocardioides speluncae]|uniref:UDP-glucose dehydrogenase family protein n=1 Tax=Nocardioides speluncae TaxID=2670337 RepID=UPI000D6876EF|nr:UDP-glucose/GDP-mannose dehydrogenase family protein [Nocardioides speluncae]